MVSGQDITKLVPPGPALSFGEGRHLSLSSEDPLQLPHLAIQNAENLASSSQCTQLNYLTMPSRRPAAGIAENLAQRRPSGLTCGTPATQYLVFRTQTTETSLNTFRNAGTSTWQLAWQEIIRPRWEPENQRRSSSLSPTPFHKPITTVRSTSIFHTP